MIINYCDKKLDASVSINEIISKYTSTHVINYLGTDEVPSLIDLLRDFGLSAFRLDYRRRA